MKKSVIWLLIFFLILIISYEPILKKLLIRWHNGDNNYCYLILPIFIYLCWEKRQSFNFNQFSGSYWGIVALIISSCIILLGELASLETFLYFGFWLSIVSLGLIFYGKNLKKLFFPLLILCFIVPLPPFINRILTFRLQMITSTLSVSIMRLIGISVFQQGNIIDLGTEQLQVAEACSGLRYFIPLVLLALLVGYYLLRRIWSRMLLLISVIPISIIANSFRISFLGFLYSRNLKKLAEGFYHYFSGWLVFMVAGAFLLMLARILRSFEKLNVKDVKSEVSKEYFSEYPSKRFISITISFIFIVLVSGITIRLLPKDFISPVETDLTLFPLQIDGWIGERFNLPKKILSSLWADEYVSAVYYRKDLPGVIYLFIPYYAYQTTRHTAHAPQSCLLGSGWIIINSGEWQLKVSSKEIIPVRYMWMEKGNQKMLATYFFLQHGQVITSPWLNKFYLLRNAILYHQTNGALVRAEMLLGEGQSFKEAEKILKSFLIYLWPILKETIPR